MTEIGPEKALEVEAMRIGVVAVEVVSMSQGEGVPEQGRGKEDGEGRGQIGTGQDKGAAEAAVLGMSADPLAVRAGADQQEEADQLHASACT